ncbi:hypothetical protein MPOCJGCO_4945 [Methylobacterium trifolii]|uniref:Glycosyltransferase subfamily 4-like N-terminal domain-containing protein n=2 Tax=Methylobacterium trifolii TaxID=1003092 RepID=A0ABQ4U760_9HYPH|nr:hypothetical protein MPOCJGCO_4945 [Methylobacterium trifolii]
MDLALALRGAGHRVAIYSPRLGHFAREIMARGVPVTNRIDRIGFVPDIIHGSHTIAVLPGLIRFPKAPAIFVCHDSSSPFDAPILLSRVGAYVAIDAACVERLVVDGIPEDRIVLLPNGVDLEAIAARQNFAPKPVRALAIVKASPNWIQFVETACASAGLELDVVGPGVGRTVGDLPERISRADIVFAHSRSAVEAASSGAAVVICDERGFGGLIGPDEAQRFPNSPLGRRIFQEPVTVAALERAIAAYNPDDARIVCEIVRERLSLDGVRAQYEAVYQRAMAEARPSKVDSNSDDAELAAVTAGWMVGSAEFEALHRRLDAVASQEATIAEWFDSHAARMLDDPRRLSLGTNASDLVRFLCVKGWSYPETWGIWSDGPQAILRIPASLVRLWGGVRILCLHAFPADHDEKDTRRVCVIIDGGPQDEWAFANPAKAGFTSKTLRFPGRTDAVQVAFRILDPVDTPAFDPNPRRLGMGILALEAPGTTS